MGGWADGRMGGWSVDGIKRTNDVVTQTRKHGTKRTTRTHE